MSSALAPSLTGPEPAERRQLVPSGVMGMLLFVFTESMLLAGMISAHTIVEAGAQEWPPFDQPRLPAAATLLNTAALLLSGGALVAARLAFGRGAARALAPLSATVLLGAAFVGLQGREWVALLAEGLTFTSSAYGSFFYLIVGTHAAHAVGAIFALAWAWGRLRAGRLAAAQLATVEVLWYFVVLWWPVIYVQVYL